MKQAKTNLSCAFILVLGLTGLQAQTSTNAAGGESSGSGGSASYSVGQVVYSTNTGTNGSVAQGVQQPYEISVIISLEEASTMQLSAYPNPTADYLMLTSDSSMPTDVYYRLMDVAGHSVLSGKLTENQTSISMTGLLPATYFLYVLQGSKEIKVFKIIKN